MVTPLATAAVGSVARRGTFAGTNVFLSRSLVPPEIFDALHDALKFNGANLFLCCDPSRSAADEFHVISSIDHEKFNDLRAKGCHLIGPQCVFSCVKERRPLPDRGYVCCLAMDGVTILASGFEKEEKVKLEQLVTAMGGTLCNKPSLEVNFVIAKNVLSAKYKWALNVLKKPIVSMSWLHQCWTEHRIVPHEPYRIPPFSGLTICVTKIPLDERKQMEKLIIQNGGCYSADLTRKCTHLISEVAEGDKYKVAKQWGHIHIVTRRWLDLSIARRACLGEEFYPVRGASVSYNDKKAPSKERANRSQTVQPAPATEVEELGPTLSQNFSSCSSDAAKICNCEADVSIQQTKDDNINGSVAEDSESDDNDLYLSNCRISIVGFGEQELRNLIILIRKGGGSRYMQLSEKLTHIVVGTPSEIEKKEVRRLAAWGIINVVKATWLQECDLAKKEVPVSVRHIFSELVPSRGFMCSNVEISNDEYSNKRARNSTVVSLGALPQASQDRTSEALPLEKRRNKERGQNGSSSCFADLLTQSQTISFNTSTTGKAGSKLRSGSSNADNQDNCSEVFQGRSFCFSRLFPSEGKAEVIEWVRRGGGVMFDNLEKGADFVIGGHGLTQLPSEESAYAIVSLHWIRFCLEEGCMHDIGAHILFTPLRCTIPFPGFEGFWFCFSYYEEKERTLLKNICRTLGAKITDKLSRKVTHLVCKFSDGPKYDFACKWGIPIVTAEWLIDCIKEEKIVPLETFQPKPVTSQERAGLCTVSQNPTQAGRGVVGLDQSQWPSDSQRPRGDPKQNTVAECSNVLRKRSRLMEGQFDGKDGTNENSLQRANAVPDVADAIEDLLAQSSKMQDIKSPETSACGQTIFPPDHSILGQDHANSHPGFGITRSWLNRSQKQDNLPKNASQDRNEGTYYAFSETQTDSQVVGYEEDLSGRQKIIDRVKSQSIAPTPDK